MRDAAHHIAIDSNTCVIANACVGLRTRRAKLDPAGALICPTFAVSSILSSKSRLNLTLSTTGRALATWSDGRNDGGDIYAQDIKADCSLGL